MTPELQAFIALAKAQHPAIRPHKEDDFDWRDEGMEFMDNGDLAKAEAKFQQLILSQPEHFDGYEGLARLYERIVQSRGFGSLLECNRDGVWDLGCQFMKGQSGDQADYRLRDSQGHRYKVGVGNRRLVGKPIYAARYLIQNSGVAKLPKCPGMDTSLNGFVRFDHPAKSTENPCRFCLGRFCWRTVLHGWKYHVMFITIGICIHWWGRNQD